MKSGDFMYRIGQQYKIQLKEKDSKTGNYITYTAEILKEDSLQISIKTLRNEELVLNKDELRQCKLMQDSRCEGGGR